MVELLDIVIGILVGVLVLCLIIAVGILIYTAIFDHLELENCKPLSNETSICYYSSENNSTKVTTKIISNNA